MSTLELSLAYDALSILFGAEPASLPVPAPGEIVVRVGAWSLQDLRACETVMRHNLMCDQDWYNEHQFSREKLTPGIYRVRLPIPDSNRNYFVDQRKLLLLGEAITPAALASTVLLCHLKQTGQDLLSDDWTRCAEVPPDGRRVALSVREGRVFVSGRLDNYADKSLWLAGCRKS